MRGFEVEPIAIIGIGCRFPGANDPESFWDLLRNGVNAVTEVPKPRWDLETFYDPKPAIPGKMNTRWGGFLEQVVEFDPGFFRISPREAKQIDPQQRLVLEVSWEALENAGIVPDKLAGSQTGVFIAIGNQDYTSLQLRDLTCINAYTAIGCTPSIAANRLSYMLDLRGPSMAIETACSSSLVAVHFACQSLQSRETNLCLVGGVNLMLSPEPTIAYSHAGMMASDGRCKTFDASADGYVRGEGCGVVILKRLQDALMDGDNVRAIIKGSAVNQDGLSNGLTAPNGPSQQAVIRQALKNALVAPAQISYVEAHGTGTPLGDPIEFDSLKAVLMEGRKPEQLCWIGSVKTNIGHLENAAGIAGLLKVVLSLQHREIPPHLHLKQLNPYISLQGTPFSIPTATECTPWSVQGERRFAGVSAFSFGGTNCHVILEESQGLKVQGQKEGFIEPPAHILTLSAKCERALGELVQRYENFLASHPKLPLGDVCFTANTGRSHFQHRLAVVAKSTEQMREQLNAFTARRDTPAWVSSQLISKKRQKIAFLFTGQGSQYINMGRQLYETQPTFRSSIERCAEILQPELNQSLLNILYPKSCHFAPQVTSPQESSSNIQNPLLNETAYTQPAIFALGYALAELWKSWGVEPSAVLGHSVGEYIAAVCAGVFSLEHGLKMVAQRARLMQTLPQDGAMVVVFADEEQVRGAIGSHAQDVAIAAYNGSTNIVISGKRQVMEEVKVALAARGVETRPLSVSHAFHSPLMEPILDTFEQIANQVPCQSPQIPFVSNLTGDMLASGQVPDGKYWRRHIRESVKFAAGLNTLLESGYKIFLEIGPKPTLLTLGKQCIVNNDVVWLPSLMQQQEDWEILLSSLSKLYVRGINVNWGGFNKDYLYKRLCLPTYPFQRQHYWFKEGEPPMDARRSHSQAKDSNEPQNLLLTQTNRRDKIVSKLRSLVGNALNIGVAEIDLDTPLLQMGADSIVLMEATRKLESLYGIKISIRQVFEELATIEALANYIDQNLSPELTLGDTPAVGSKPHPQSPPTPPALQTSTPPNGITQTSIPEAGFGQIIVQQIQMMQQQLQVTSQQLELLQTSLSNSPQTFSPQNGVSGPKSASQDAQTLSLPQPIETKSSPLQQPIETKSSIANVTAPASKPFFHWEAHKLQPRELNQEQQHHLQALIERYTKRTQKSKQRSQTYRPVLADKRSSIGFRFETKEMLYPIVGERFHSSRMWDIDGNEYIDLTMGFGVHLFGHNAPFIAEALESQIKQGAQIGPQSYLAGEVAELICKLTGTSRVCFCNSGTEAVMTAVRLARAVTGRSKIVLFKGSYHGHFDGTLAIPVSQGEGNQQAAPMMSGVLQHMVDDVLLLTYGAPQALDFIKAHAHELAAVLVEPVQSRQPDLQPREFLHELSAITQKAGIALIFDEIITGFRIHPGGAQAWFGVEADIVTYGKSLGGGMPIGVVAGKTTYLDAIDGGQWYYGDTSYPEVETTFFAGTFSKHPLAMAAARAVLQHLKAEGAELQERLNQKTSELVFGLNAYFQEAEIPLSVVHCGSLFRFNNPSYLFQPLEMDLLFYHLIEKGIYIWEGRTCFLSTAHTDEDINYVLSAVKQSIEELREGGFFPRGKAPVVSQEKKIEKTFLLTKAQQQLWILAQIGGDEGSLAYNVSINLQLRGVLHLNILQQVLQKIVDRHEALRTIINPEGESQQILPEVKIQVPVIDFSGFDVREQELKISAWLAFENKLPFELINQPLFRVRLLKLEEQFHLLVLKAHHIVVDGWSMGLIIQELGELYSAKCQNVASSLESPMQFREYISRHEQQSQIQAMDAHESYWLRQFSDGIPVLELPTDRTRPPIKTYQGSRRNVILDTELCQALKKVSKEKGCTLFMTLLSTYFVLLHRLTGQDDIIVGIPTSLRTLAGSDKLVGYCANLLPIRSRIVGQPTFSDYLATIKGLLLELYEHQNYHFAKLIDKLDIKRDTSRTPLVTTMFNLERAVVPEFIGLEVNILSQSTSFAAYDIQFNIVELGDGTLLVEADYSTDLFEAATVERWLGYFQTLLAAIASNPEQSVWQLSLLTSVEQHQLLVSWNATDTYYPADLCIHQLFEEQVKKTPDAVAVEFETQSLTYRELNKRANQLAHFLQEMGIQPEVLVGIYVERSLDMMVGLLGILKAGGTYVPLDPTYPQERLTYILNDAGVSLLLTQQELVDSLPEHQAKVICLDMDFWQTLDSPLSSVSARNLAYIIYTSGSTGRPKGVQISHQSAVNFLEAMRQRLELTSADTLLAVTTICFDISVLEFFLPLIVGAKVIIASREIAIDGTRLLSELAASQITAMQATPVTWQMLLASGWSGTQPLKVFCGGEALTGKLAQQLLETGSKVWNFYGPTETTIWSMICRLEGSTADINNLPAVVPIGKPIANTLVYILDRYLQPVPIGVVGEIHLGGVGLARGYLNHPELTKERFIPNPFSSSLEGQLYKTGDLGRYKSDGSIEFLGRLDNQVKIHGFRIELGEIEAALSQHPMVREVVVIASLDRPGEERLVAYVVLAQHQEVTADELRNLLRKRVPAYMMPSTFVMLDTLPLTPNGKVDRRRLPAPDVSQRILENSFVGPRTATEAAIAAIWSEVLQCERVSIYDNFFDIGGNSLLIILLNRKIHKALKTDIEIVDLFKYPTISALAQYLNQNTQQPTSLEKIHNRTGKQREALLKQQQISKQRKKGG
ncbi:hypothetical protein NUACC21_66040 [Scytonema sp. NUACC21]